MEKKRFNVNLDDSAFTKEKTPLKSLFKPSSNRGQNVSSASPEQPAQPTAGQSLSYAEFVTRINKPPAPRPLSSNDANPQTSSDFDIGATSSSTSQQGCQDAASCGPKAGEDVEMKPSTVDAGEETQKTGAEKKDLEGQRSEPNLNLGSKPVGSGSSIIVSPRQRGNPILKFVRIVPWEFGEIVPDYVLGQTTCALFLSLRYHNLHPNYIHDRLKQLGQTFTLRVLLVQVDVKDPHHALKELAHICMMADCTLILAWSPEEAGRYLETFKSYEKKPADLLKEQVEKNYLAQVTDCLTTVKSINKTDAMTLLSTFSSMEGIINASKEDLVLCPGMGPQKARRLHDVLHQPFLKSKKKDS